MQEKWIDFHSHILPGVDDGSRSMEETLDMFRQEAEQGVGIVIATPHFYAHQDRPETFLRRRTKAEKALRQVWERGMPSVGMGAEVTYFTGMKTCEELRALCIRGTNLLLIEMPFCTWSQEVIQEISFLQNRLGYQIVLAHVERYLGFHNGRALDFLYSEGIRFQVNAGAFQRWKTRGKVLRMLQDGKISVLGSDCHNMTTRPPNLEPAIQYIDKECGTVAVRRLQKNAERLLYGTAAKQGKRV